MRRLILLAVASVAACAVTPEPPANDALPTGVLAAIAAERPDFVYGEHERKDRNGRTYFDVEGVSSSGEEIEFDVLMTQDGPQIVEIQRDLDWAKVPGEVRNLALDASGGSVPLRIIESVQTDGAVIYELFAEGQPTDPALEVRVHGGTAEILAERWLH